jgi:hypothetical protein
MMVELARFWPILYGGGGDVHKILWNEKFQRGFAVNFAKYHEKRSHLQLTLGCLMLTIWKHSRNASTWAPTLTANPNLLDTPSLLL